MPNRPEQSDALKRPARSKPARKKTAALPVAGRVTVGRSRKTSKVNGARAVASSGAFQPERRATPRLLRRGFPDVETATRYLLSRADELVQDGVLPRLPVEAYLDALLPVLAFIYARASVFSEANLGPEVCAAVEQIAQEVQSLPDDPLPLARSGEHVREAVSTGALLLTAYRDAIRRVARGPKGQEARADFGVGEDLDPRDAQKVAQSIEHFLHATHKHAAYMAEAGLSHKQLDGLAAQRRVILARMNHHPETGLPTEKRRTQVLHAALAYFFDRFSAAVCAKFLHQPEERVRGLKLVPRDSTNRQGGQRSTDPR